MAISEARLNRWKEVMRCKLIRCKLEGNNLFYDL